MIKKIIIISNNPHLIYNNGHNHKMFILEIECEGGSLGTSSASLGYIIFQYSLKYYE